MNIGQQTHQLTKTKSNLESVSHKNVLIPFRLRVVRVKKVETQEKSNTNPVCSHLVRTVVVANVAFSEIVNEQCLKYILKVMDHYKCEH